MDILLEVFVTKVLAIAVDQVDAISRFGRRLLMSANQIRDLARRGRNRIYTLAQIRTMTNKPITFIEEPPAPSRACKRLHTGEFADKSKRLAYQEAIAQGFNDRTVDISDKLNIMEASNCGNLYGANGTNGIIKTASNNAELNQIMNMAIIARNLWGESGTTGSKMVSDNDELYGIKADEAIIIVSNDGNLYGGNGTNGTKKMANDNGEFDEINNKMTRKNCEFNVINKDEAIIAMIASSLLLASNGGNLYGGNGTNGTNKMSSKNDDLMAIDDDTTSIGSAINGN